MGNKLKLAYEFFIDKSKPSKKISLENFHRKKDVNDINDVNRFNDILDFANSVLAKYKGWSKVNNRKQLYTHPLNDVIKLIGIRIQVEYLTRLLTVKDNQSPLYPEELFFKYNIPITKDGKTLSDFQIRLPIEKKVDLGRDLILPGAWNRNRLIENFATIGEGRICGSWRQDTNHKVEVWLPLNIAWVNGGNHSITVGIVQCSGEITANYVYDISKLYDHIYCDGRNYLRIEDNINIAPVRNVDFAAIFEIGRIIKENNL